MTTTRPHGAEDLWPVVPVPRLVLPRAERSVGGRPVGGGPVGGGQTWAPADPDGVGPPPGVLPTFDPDQVDVVEHRQGGGPLLVVGAPGTGKTSVLVEAAARRVERDGVAVESLLLLAPTRPAAAQLRQALSRRLARSTREPLARTPYAFAYGLLRRARVLEGAIAPRLLSAAEQDRVLGDLLQGHELGEGSVPLWPGDLPPAVRALEGFRDELRALLMRAVERGITPRELGRLGRKYGHPAWVPAAAVLREYLEVTSLASPGAFDPAAIVDSATALLESEPGLLEAERERVAFLAVDDAHELSAASYRLLDVLTGGRGELLLVGDPDAGTDTFRGAQPHVLASTPSRYRRPDGQEGRTVVLRTVHRHGAELRAVASRVVAGIGAAGVVRHRTAVASPDAPAAGAAPEVALLPSPAQEAAFIAHRLRETRLRDGVAWSRMAVILRSARDTSVLRRALAAHGIPLGVAPTTSPLRDEPAVVPLRLALRCALHPEEPGPELAEALVTSVLGGADAIGLRALRRHLRHSVPEEDADLLLARAIGAPVQEPLEGGTLEGRSLEGRSLEGRSPERAAPVAAAWSQAPVAAPLRRVVRVVSAGRLAAQRPGADGHTVLWAIWEACGLAQTWQVQSLAGGTRGARADRDLDAVTALFASAARFVERSPHAGAEAFLAELEGHAVPADTLAERARTGGAVTVTTAHRAAGQEWDVVVVAGVQEGVWPDLRPRSSLLGAQELADLVDGRLPAEGGGARGAGRDAVRERRRTILSDELRLFHVAVSRARTRLLVTAVRSDDLLPSPFLEAVRPPGDGPERDEVTRLTVVPRAMTLPALVAQLRSVVTDSETPRGRREEAARGLARLAAAGVPGADPDSWYGLAGVSSEAALRDPSAAIRVSPSKVEAYQRCPLRWLLEQSGGTRGSSVSQELGSMVHAIAEVEPEGRIEELRRLLDERWTELGLPDGWPAHALRRRAERMLEKFAEYARESRREGRELVATEVPVGATLGRAVVKGKIDRLERARDGSYVVVDLKTGSTAPTRAELPQHAQLGVYQAAVEAGGCGEGKVSGGAALVQLGGRTRSTSVQVQPALARAEDPEWAATLVESTAEGMAGADFPATVNRMCRMCDLKRSCPAQVEGRRVGP